MSLHTASFETSHVPTSRSTLQPHVLPDDDAVVHVKLYKKGLAARKKLDTARSSLTPEQRQRARKTAAEGEVSAQKLVESMLKLSTRIVREISEARHGREGARSLQDDLLSDAHMAVLEAAKSFEPSKGVGFSRWAAQRVRHTIRAAVMEDNPAGLKIYSSWSRMRRRTIPERQELAEKLGYEPSMAELKEHMLNVCIEWAYEHLGPEERELPPAERREAAIAKLRKQGTLSAIENLEDVLNAGEAPSRLDAPFGREDDDATLGLTLKAEGAEDIAQDAATLTEVRSVILQALSELSPREQTILLYRYGFVDGEPWTYRSIGEMFNISAERVRQIEEKTREHLRDASPSSYQLWSHLHPELVH